VAPSTSERSSARTEKRKKRGKKMKTPLAALGRNKFFVKEKERMEELTVAEILQGFYRKEYLQHRVQLLQLLTNHFAEEIEHTQEETIAKIDSETCVENDPSTNSNANKKKEPADPEVFRQLVRIMLDFADNNKSSPEVVYLSLTVLTNATVNQVYALQFLDSIEIEDSPISQKFHSVINQYLEYNPQSDADETEDWTTRDPFQYVGSILWNLSESERGRKIILHTGRGYMMKFPAQVRNNRAKRNY
jgi:hypothetical protein